MVGELGADVSTRPPTRAIVDGEGGKPGREEASSLTNLSKLTTGSARCSSWPSSLISTVSTDPEVSKRKKFANPASSHA